MTSIFSFPTKTLFGAGSLAELPARLVSLGVSRPLVVTDRGLPGTDAFSRFQKISQDRWPVFAGVTPNPVEQDVEQAAAAYREYNCDGVIAIGGGSALDVGKALRLRIKRPEISLRQFDWKADWGGLASCIAIPTTAGTGSEVGRSSVVTIDGTKRVFFQPALLAVLVILDPELTIGLPPKLTAATGADALTHCIESYTSPVFHPLCDGIALEGLHLIASALPRVMRDGGDIDARGKMLVAASMGAIAFQKDLGAVHSLAHPLSAICGMHHGTANALCLPAVMEFNTARKPGIYERVALAMNTGTTDDEAIAGIEALLEEIGLVDGLRTHGARDDQLDALADQAFADSCHLTNPVPVTRADLRRLYERAM